MPRRKQSFPRAVPTVIPVAPPPAIVVIPPSRAHWTAALENAFAATTMARVLWTLILDYVYENARVFISDYGARWIDCYDRCSGQRLYGLHGGKKARPVAVAVLREHTVFVADLDEDVLMYSWRSGRFRRRIVPHPGATRIATDNVTNELLVMNALALNGRIDCYAGQKDAPDRVRLSIVPVSGPWTTPYGARMVARDGKCYLAADARRPSIDVYCCVSGHHLHSFVQSSDHCYDLAIGPPSSLMPKVSPLSCGHSVLWTATATMRSIVLVALETGARVSLGDRFAHFACYAIDYDSGVFVGVRVDHEHYLVAFNRDGREISRHSFVNKRGIHGRFSIAI